MQMLVETKRPGYPVTSTVLLEDIENGGVPTTIAYYFQSHENLVEMTFKFADETITYRRID